MKQFSIKQKISLILGIACLLIATHLLSVSGLVSAHPTQSRTDEIRGVWLTNVGSSVFFAPWGIHRALHQLASLNFNTVYPVVWNRGYTFYPSDTAQHIIGHHQAPLFSVMHPGTDVLKSLIRVGHRHQLNVIPWFEYGFMVPPRSKLAVAHPDWLTTTANSNPESATDWTVLFKRDKPAIADWTSSANLWLNPFHPEVQDFILQLILEVVTHYDVDGIQLDDHFGLPIEMGYDPVTIQLYRRSHQGQSPPVNPADPEWVRWRADQISAFMGKVVEAIRAVKPDCIISLSPNPQDFAYSRYLQDWQRWVEQGWIDELVLQVYRNELSQLQAELSRASVKAAQQQIPVAIALLSGIWSNPVGIPQLQAQVDLVRQNQFDGVSFFYWESLMGYLAPESPAQRQHFLKTIFADS